MLLVQMAGENSNAAKHIGDVRVADTNPVIKDPAAASCPKLNTEEVVAQTHPAARVAD